MSAGTAAIVSVLYRRRSSGRIHAYASPAVPPPRSWRATPRCEPERPTRTRWVANPPIVCWALYSDLFQSAGWRAWLSASIHRGQRCRGDHPTRPWHYSRLPILHGKYNRRVMTSQRRDDAAAAPPVPRGQAVRANNIPLTSSTYMAQRRRPRLGACHRHHGRCASPQRYCRRRPASAFRRHINMEVPENDRNTKPVAPTSSRNRLLSDQGPWREQLRRYSCSALLRDVLRGLSATFNADLRREVT